MAKIWEKDWLYGFLRPYVDECTRGSYSSLRVEGSIPEGPAVILAPNHCNTLLDALVVLQSRKAPTVFGARADIFRRPRAARALRFLKILPMARERDGLASQRSSYGSFDEIEDCLANSVPFCLFPEGRHTPGHEVQELMKGVIRIALRSASLRHTVIVPTGITYSHFFRYRGRCLVRYGEPLDVNAFLEGNSGLTEKELTDALLADLRSRIQSLVNPERLSAPQAWRWLLLPLWPVAAILSLPLWLTAEAVCARLGDKAFANSVRFLVKLFLTPVFFIIWAVLWAFLLPWWACIALLVLFLFSYSIFYDLPVR